MGLINLGSVNAAAIRSLPTVTVSAPAVQGNVTAVTVSLARNGVSGPVPFTWSVSGNGANPIAASDFIGGALPNGSAVFAEGEDSKVIVLPTTTSGGAGKGLTLAATASLPLALASGSGAIPTGNAPVASALLMGSRFNQMGFNGYAGSSGTDTDSNFRLASFNETGASVTNLRAYFANWSANATNEQDGFNPITVTAAVEYPAGTFQPLTFAGATSVIIPASGANLAESDDATLRTAIPAGAQYWLRTYVSVASGGKWPQGYLANQGSITALGEAADFSTGVDKTAGGTITNATGSTTRRGYGPVAVKATGFAGTPIAKAFAAVGDSIVMGSTDAADPIATGHGNIGYFAKAAAGLYPVLNLGIAGTRAFENLPASFARRGDLLAKAGITHVFCDWSVNDIVAGRTAAQLATNVAAIAAGFRSSVPGVRVVWSTITPKTSSTDGWKTIANQTPFASPSGAFANGASSVRSVFNAALRTGISGVDVVFDAADVAETSRDSGVWRAGEGSTYLTGAGASSDAFTSDGLHPSAFNTAAAGLGGVYVMRDAVRLVFAGW